MLAGIAGFLALALEVFWFRSLILIFGSTTYSLSAMLGIFLAGTAVGPMLLGWIGDRRFAASHTPLIAGLAFSTILTLLIIPVMIAAPSVWVKSWHRIMDRRATRRNLALQTATANAGTGANTGNEEAAPAQQEQRPPAQIVAMPKKDRPTEAQQDLPQAAE